MTGSLQAKSPFSFCPNFSLRPWAAANWSYRCYYFRLAYRIVALQRRSKDWLFRKFINQEEKILQKRIRVLKGKKNVISGISSIWLCLMLEITISFYRCELKNDCEADSVQTKSNAMNNRLDNVSPSFPGLIARFKQGSYYYMCSRNNNFTNRSQKGMIVVK